MALIDLTLAKQHLRVDHSDEDTLIGTYVAAALAHIKTYLNVHEIPIEDDVKAAALLLVEDLYANRSAKIEGGIKDNPAVTNLLHPHRQNLGI
jgi:uncharacterized phage protein (predicted DNA packaging)